MNTEGNNASSFGVSYQIQGFWQYLKTLLAQSSRGSFPQGKTIKGMVDGSEMFF
jgi:hypothetical protein